MTKILRETRGVRVELQPSADDDTYVAVCVDNGAILGRITYVEAASGFMQEGHWTAETVLNRPLLGKYPSMDRALTALLDPS